MAVIFFALAVFFCPLVRPVFGLDATTETAALHLYYWSGSILFLLLAILELPKLSRALKRLAQYALMFLITLMTIEAASAIVYKWKWGYWSHLDNTNLNRHLFEKHPYLVGSPIANARLQRDSLLYAHNSHGFRGAEFDLKKPAGKTRIVTLGGSTTYGVGVNNEETWPYLLQQQLGSDFEVINMGVPGYSSAENLIQTALLLSDFDADLVIYHVGLNDLRNMNVHDLKADYSDFHAPTMFNSMGLCHLQNAPMLASIRLLLIGFQNMGVLEFCPGQELTIGIQKHNGVDKHAQAIYKRNLKNITALCAVQKLNVLFVPQIMLEDVLKTGNYSWWIPYVPNDQIDDMMAAYNQTLKDVADSSEAAFASSVLDHPWKKEDFVDMSHFNGEANRQFAKLLVPEVIATLQPDTIQ